MKLTELDTETTDSIYVARLPPAGASEPAIEVAPHPAYPAGSQPSGIVKPPPLAFVTEEARSRRISSRAALLLVILVVMAALSWVLIDSSSSGRSTAPPTHRAPVRLTPSQQRAAAAARARAAAIAQLKHDRGTDAQWQDTIPPAPRLTDHHQR